MSTSLALTSFSQSRTIFSISEVEATEIAKISLVHHIGTDSLRVIKIEKESLSVIITAYEDEYEDLITLSIDKYGNVRARDKFGDSICLHAQLKTYKWLMQHFKF